MSFHMNIEQLVTSIMEGAEITPSAGVWRGIRRKLWWRQFLRFHPGQFNVFTLGSLLVAGTVFTLMLSLHGPDPEELTVKDKIPVQVNEGNIIIETNPQTEHLASAGTSVGTSDKEVVSKPEEEIEVTAALADAPLPKREISEQLNSFTPVERKVSAPAGELPLTLKPEAMFSPSASSGCAPLLVRFENLSVHGTSHRWTFGDGGASTERDVEHLFSEPGSYMVTLAIANEAGVGSRYQFPVEVFAGPGAAFEIEPEEHMAAVEGSYRLRNRSTGAFAYSWSLLDGSGKQTGHWSSNEFQPVISSPEYEGATSLRLVTTNEMGCTDTSIRKVTALLKRNQRNLLFANAFSPNPTGPEGGSYSPHEKRRDLFYPIFTEAPQQYHLRIFTRRGELVFETREIYQGWDGYYHQERSAPDVYVWMVEATWSDGEEFRDRGDVTLIWTE
jgi:hypothetical protein